MIYAGSGRESKEGRLRFGAVARSCHYTEHITNVKAKDRRERLVGKEHKGP